MSVFDAESSTEQAVPGSSLESPRIAQMKEYLSGKITQILDAVPYVVSFVRGTVANLIRRVIQNTGTVPDRNPMKDNQSINENPVKDGSISTDHGSVDILAGKGKLVIQNEQPFLAYQNTYGVQNIPLIECTIGGERVCILGGSTFTMQMTPEQEQRFKGAGGIMNPAVSEVLSNPMAQMACWEIDCRDIQISISNSDSDSDSKKTRFLNFDDWKRMYACILARDGRENITEGDATNMGLYPSIYLYTPSAQAWLMNDIFPGLQPLRECKKIKKIENADFVSYLSDIMLLHALLDTNASLARFGQVPMIPRVQMKYSPDTPNSQPGTYVMNCALNQLYLIDTGILGTDATAGLLLVLMVSNDTIYLGPHTLLLPINAPVSGIFAIPYEALQALQQ